MKNRPPLREQIGIAIRKRREAKSWTQEAFADYIQMHRAQYGLIERGGRDIQLSSLERVCAGLEEPIWVIMREAEES